MQMSYFVFFCPTCLSRITKWGGPALEVYQTMCRVFCSGIIPEFKNSQEDSVLHFLETKAYIITTETGERAVRAVPRYFFVKNPLTEEGEPAVSLCSGCNQDELQV
jgi:hypothetical protein